MNTSVHIVAELMDQSSYELLDDLCEKTGCQLSHIEKRKIMKGKDAPWQIQKELRNIYNERMAEEKIIA